MNPVRKGLKEYLAVRRALGYELRLATGALHKFVDFLEERGALHITTQLAVEWAKQPKDAQRATWSQRLSMVRCFARHSVATNPLTEIPPDRLLACRIPRRNPYIYTNDEVVRLIASAKQLSSTIGLRPWTYSTLFGLIAVTGMRIAEPLGLERDDVDLDAGIITIRKTKFRKSRLVPVHASTKRVLLAYARRRDRVFPRASCPIFFLTDRGTPLTQCSVRWTFVKLSCKIGLREPAKSHGKGPRLHDFRHRVAVKTLVQWYKSGVDVEQNLPKLSTYLGHAKVTDTYWYLSATPELLELAAERLQPTKERLLS
jgi:integrase